MINTEDSNVRSTSFEKSISQVTENVYSSVYEQLQEKRQSKLISMIASQLPNFPFLVEELMAGKEYALDISKELAEKLATGEISFGTYKDSRTKYAQFINPENSRVIKNIPIKELSGNLGQALAMAGLTFKLEEISQKLDALNEKIDRVNRNFDLNRYAEVQSSKEKFEMALLIKNQDTKSALLLNALSQATTAKNLLLHQLLENKLELKNTKLKHKEADRIATITLENLSYMKDAFYIQISSLFELGEFDALSYTLSEFKVLILKNFSGDDALYLDGNLSKADNPFKFLSNNIVNSSAKAIAFIEENEELFNMKFVSAILDTTKKLEAF